MKKLLVLIGILAANVSYASRVSNHTIDMTGGKFVDRSFNLMDDSIIGSFDRLLVKLDGKINEDFTVEAKASNSVNTSCSYQMFRVSSSQTLISVIAGVDTDDGETCDLTITYRRTGRHAVLSIYEEGT